MRLAKPHVDIGLFTNNGPALLDFWQKTVGLPFDETLPLGGGNLQERHRLNGSVFKLNVSRSPLEPQGPSGYRELLVAREGLSGPVPLVDPEGNRVTLVPPGFGSVNGIAILMAVTDEAAFDAFYTAMGFEPVGPNAYLCGDTVIRFAQDASADRVGAMRGPGYRYLTVQVWNVDEEHAGLLSLGIEEGAPPRTLGATARISFVRDPDGNWIEVSQRASLTGALPE